MAMLPLKSSRNEQHAVIHFVSKRIYHTHPTVQNRPPVIIIFLGRWRKC